MWGWDTRAHCRGPTLIYPTRSRFRPASSNCCLVPCTMASPWTVQSTLENTGCRGCVRYGGGPPDPPTFLALCAPSHRPGMGGQLYFENRLTHAIRSRGQPGGRSREQYHLHCRAGRHRPVHPGVLRTSMSPPQFSGAGAGYPRCDGQRTFAPLASMQVQGTGSAVVWTRRRYTRLRMRLCHNGHGPGQA
jgi:hypothetical protein